MLGGVHTTVMDTTSGYDRNIAVLSDIEIIVYKVCHAGNADDHRDVNFLALCIAINIDIDARLVRLLLDLNMLTVTVADGRSVLAQIESALLGKSVVIDDFQYLFYYMIQLYHYALTPAFPAHA